MDGAAFSYGTYKQEVKNWICDNFEPGASILDVGAGSGTYGNLLKDKYHNIDGVEIYYPNIIDYKLLDLYRAVYCRNIVGLEYPSYDLIIFGDVIEHLSVEDAQKVLDYARNKCRNMIVAVPYRYHQEGNENEHERHIQDDLTKENVLERYPFLKPLYTNFSYGYYIKNE
jgi:2-polyprenyl-3-methyl-5-hydroxy-6-metoxy-1,4-benzoquinol methylase